MTKPQIHTFIESIRNILPDEVEISLKTEYGNDVAVIENGNYQETIVLTGFNKTYCAKRILNSEPVTRALK